MRFEINGMKEIRRSECVDMRDFIVFRQGNNYLHCEDIYFSEKLKNCQSVDLTFQSFEWNPPNPDDDYKLLIMRLDEVHAKDYAVFVQDYIDIWCYVDISDFEVAPMFGDIYYITVRYNNEV